MEWSIAKINFVPGILFLTHNLLPNLELLSYDGADKSEYKLGLM